MNLNYGIDTSSDGHIYSSESLKALAPALCSFQAAVSNVSKDGRNPFFKSKYATLENIIATIRQPLADNGLSFTQFPTGENQLSTMLMHSSGEFIEATAKMTPKDNSPQAQGSAITYLRRYALSAILGLATEEDDDGNAASTPSKMETYQTPRIVPPADDEAGGNTQKVEQFLEQDEIEAVLKDAIKDLLHNLGHKPGKKIIKELTGLDMEPVNYDTIREILAKKLEATDPLETVIPE